MLHGIHLQIPQQHQNGHLSHGRDIQRRLTKKVRTQLTRKVEKSGDQSTPFLARPPQSSYQPRRSRTHTRPSERPRGLYTQHLVRPKLQRQKAQDTAKGRTKAARSAQRDAGETRGVLLLLFLRPHRKWVERAVWCTLVSSRYRLRKHARRRSRGGPLAGVQRLPIW